MKFCVHGKGYFTFQQQTQLISLIKLDQTLSSNVNYVLVSSTHFYTLHGVEILLLRWIK